MVRRNHGWPNILRGLVWTRSDPPPQAHWCSPAEYASWDIVDIFPLFLTLETSRHYQFLSIFFACISNFTRSTSNNNKKIVKKHRPQGDTQTTQNSQAAFYLINLFFISTLEQQLGSRAGTKTCVGYLYASVESYTYDNSHGYLESTEQLSSTAKTCITSPNNRLWEKYIAQINKTTLFYSQNVHNFARQ